MMKNKLRHDEMEASITFDSEKMMLVGEIVYMGGIKHFYGNSIAKINEEFLHATKIIKEHEHAIDIFVQETAPLSDLVQAGDARVSIDRGQSDELIGMIIKTLLANAEGAAFQVQEQPRTSLV